MKTIAAAAMYGALALWVSGVSAQPAGTFTTWTPIAESALAIPDRRLLQTIRFERGVFSN